MPEGKKAAVPAPKPVREEDLYSAKTHLHQPVPVQENGYRFCNSTAGRCPGRRAAFGGAAGDRYLGKAV